MNKIEIIATVSEETRIDKEIVENIVNSFLSTVSDRLSKNDTIKLVGFATLSTKNMKERVGNNPKTGEKIVISERKKLVFKPGKNLLKIIS